MNNANVVELSEQFIQHFHDVATLCGDQFVEVTDVTKQNNNIVLILLKMSDALKHFFF